MPEYVWVRDTEGVEYAVVASALDPEIHTEVPGAVVVLDAFGVPVRYGEPEEGPGASDNKQAWIDYAVTRGMDPAEAAAATKAHLIATYGKE